jgi:hypothetical protein
MFAVGASRDLARIVRFGVLRNALRNVKGILYYTVWGVPPGIVDEPWEGNWP